MEKAVVTTPKGKSLGYDVTKVVKILEESETPKIAVERLQKELNLNLHSNSISENPILKLNGFEELSNEETIEMALMNLNMPLSLM